MSLTLIIGGATAAVGVATAATAGYLYWRYSAIGTDMGALTFYWRLIRGKGVRTVGPAQLDRMLAEEGVQRVFVDLRAPDHRAEYPIEGLTPHPFDDFLKDVVVDGAYTGDRSREVVLLCDTGHMSVVAGDILVADEGFEAVYSLKGGTKGYERYRGAACKPCSSVTSMLSGCCR